MKSPDLIQSTGLHKVELTLEADGISVFEKNFSRSNKTHIYFENIPPTSSEFTPGSKRVLVGSIVFSILAAVCLPLAASKIAAWSAPLVWGVVAGIFWIGYYSSRKSLVRFIQNGAGLNLYKDKPSEKAVDEFIKKMFEFRKKYLLKKFGHFLDEESFENKMNRLNYLRARDVINEQEFDSKREEFSMGINKPPGPVGFAQQ